MSGSLGKDTSSSLHSEIRTVRGYATLSPTEKKVIQYLHVTTRGGAYASSIAKALGYIKASQISPILHRLVKKGALVRGVSIKGKGGKPYALAPKEEEKVVYPTPTELKTLQSIGGLDASPAYLAETLNTSIGNVWVIAHRLMKKGWIQNIGENGDAIYRLAENGVKVLEDSSVIEEKRLHLNRKYYTVEVKQKIELNPDQILFPGQTYSLPRWDVEEIIGGYGRGSITIFSKH